MKIIASTNHPHRNTFIVEMAEDEIIKAAGFSCSYDSAWEARNGGRSVKVGTEIKVDVAYDYHHRVLRHQREAGSAANTLRALADLIGGALPDVVIPPVDVKTEGAEA